MNVSISRGSRGPARRFRVRSSYTLNSGMGRQHTGSMQSVVLLSGGLDSATVLAIARSEKRDCIALSFAYGQRHEIELDAARRVAQSMNVSEHVIYPLDLRMFGGSALTGNVAVPKDAVGA